MIRRFHTLSLAAAAALLLTAVSSDLRAVPGADASMESGGSATSSRAPLPDPGATVQRRDSGTSLADRLAAEAPELDRDVLDRALYAVARARSTGQRARNPHLTIIDFSLPSTERRFWLFDLEREELLYHELVAHGKNTGGKHAERFSNVEGSKQSSLGLFLTGKTYYGGNGYSLRLHGLERGLNHRALERLIVMHGAWYVSDDHVRKFGRLGRSWGCPALDERIASDVIDLIKGGSYVFAYSDRGMEPSTLLADFPGGGSSFPVRSAR